MLLEGRPAGWFSNVVELSLDGQPIGNIKPKWFGEGFKLDLLGQPVSFEKPSWTRSHFVLKDAAGIELGSATLEGWLKMRWQMKLGSGDGYLEKSSWFKPDLVLTQDGKVTATAKTTSLFGRTWQVIADEGLPAVDVLLVGLVYSLVRHRDAQRSSH